MDDVHGLHDKLEASAEHIVKRVDEAGKDLASESDRLESLVRESRPAEDSISDMASRLDAKLVQANERHDAESEQLSATIARVEGALTERLVGLERSSGVRVDAVEAAVEAKLAEVKSSMDDIADQLRKQLNLSTESLASKLQSVWMRSTPSKAEQHSGSKLKSQLPRRS